MWLMMYLQHPEQILDYLLLVNQTMQLPKVHHKLGEVNLVQQNFQNEWVFLRFKIHTESSNTDFEYLPKIRRSLVQSVVVCFLADQEDHLHKKQECQVFICPFISLNDEL